MPKLQGPRKVEWATLAGDQGAGDGGVPGGRLRALATYGVTSGACSVKDSGSQPLSMPHLSRHQWPGLITCCTLSLWQVIAALGKAGFPVAAPLLLCEDEVSLSLSLSLSHTHTHTRSLAFHLSLSLAVAAPLCLCEDQALPLNPQPVISLPLSLSLSLSFTHTHSLTPSLSPSLVAAPLLLCEDEAFPLQP